MVGGGRSHAAMASAWRPCASRANACDASPSLPDCSSTLEVALLPERVDDAGGQVGIQALGLAMGGQRSLVQARVAAHVHEAREQLRVVARVPGQAQQAHHGLLRTADLRLQLRVELLDERQPGAELLRAPQCVLGPRQVGGEGGMSRYFPIIRSTRPRRAQAGANPGSSATHLR